MLRSILGVLVVDCTNQFFVWKHSKLKHCRWFDVLIVSKTNQPSVHLIRTKCQIEQLIRGTSNTLHRYWRRRNDPSKITFDDFGELLSLCYWTKSKIDTIVLHLSSHFPLTFGENNWRHGSNKNLCTPKWQLR